MDNLGEPMDFVEYRVDDDDDDVQAVEHGDALMSDGAEVNAGDITGPPGTTRADVESAGPSGSGARSSNADTGTTTTSHYGIQEAVCYLNPPLFVYLHHLYTLQLRLSPTLSV